MTSCLLLCDNNRQPSRPLMYSAALLCVLFGVCLATPLNQFVSHFEPLNYDHQNLLWNHHRVRRSNIGPKEIELHIDAFGRFFDLILFPDNELFGEETEVLVDGRPFPMQHVLSVMYSGHDIADATITAHGHVAYGVFDGVIKTEDETYYVEPASRYSVNSSDYHSVIYRHSDLNSSSVNLASCGGSLAQNFQKNIKRSESSFPQSDSAGSSRHGGAKRQAPSDKTRCWLNVLGDYDFFNAVAVGATTQDRKIQAMATLSTIVKQASAIYQTTDFITSSGGTINGITFGIMTLNVETAPPTTPPFNNPYIGVQAFLDYHSQANYSQYCLSYRFTYRQFDQGVIGLAYVAADGSLGGICDKPTTVDGKLKTLNTGIVTLLNYGQRVPLIVNILTFAHEAGHNFGSIHDADTDPVCAPANGKFIMYAHATDGSQPNNIKFSSCSKRLMGGIIQERQDKCFNPDVNCRNGFIDPGEDCDCGNVQTCLSDPCCNATACKLNPGAQCSPQVGTCCNATSCSYIPANASVLCASETECASNQTCNGTSNMCPTPMPKPSNMSHPLLCGSNGAYCKNGACTGTICDVVLGVANCECTAAEHACDVCCMFNTTCVSSFSFNTSYLATHNIIPQHLQIGLPCGNFTGHCDFLNNCQLVNSQGALELVFSTITSNLGNILIQLKKYWWAVLLAGVGVLVAMFLLVLACHFILPRPQKARRKAQERINNRRHKDMEMRYPQK